MYVFAFIISFSLLAGEYRLAAGATSPIISSQQGRLKAGLAFILGALGAVDAIARVGHDFQPPFTDVAAALLAFAERALLNAVQSGGYLDLQLPGIGQQTGAHLLFERVGAKVSQVHWYIRDIAADIATGLAQCIAYHARLIGFQPCRHLQQTLPVFFLFFALHDDRSSFVGADR